MEPHSINQPNTDSRQSSQSGLINTYVSDGVDSSVPSNSGMTDDQMAQDMVLMACDIPRHVIPLFQDGLNQCVTQGRGMMVGDMLNSQLGYCNGFADRHVPDIDTQSEGESRLARVKPDWLFDGNNFVIGSSIKPLSKWSLTDVYGVFAYPWHSLHFARSRLLGLQHWKTEFFWGFLRGDHGWLWLPSFDTFYTNLFNFVTPRCRFQSTVLPHRREITDDQGRATLSYQQNHMGQLSLAVPLPWFSVCNTLAGLRRWESRHTVVGEMDSTLRKHLDGQLKIQGIEHIGWADLLAHPRVESALHRRITGAHDTCISWFGYALLHRLLFHLIGTKRRFEQCVVRSLEGESSTSTSTASGSTSFFLEEMAGNITHHLSGFTSYLFGISHGSRISGQIEHVIMALKEHQDCLEKDDVKYQQSIQWSEATSSCGLYWDTGLGRIMRWALGPHVAPGWYLQTSELRSRQCISNRTHPQIELKEPITVRKILRQESGRLTWGKVTRSLVLSITSANPQVERGALSANTLCTIAFEEEYKPLWGPTAVQEVFPLWEKLLACEQTTQDQEPEVGTLRRQALGSGFVVTLDYSSRFVWQASLAQLNLPQDWQSQPLVSAPLSWGARWSQWLGWSRPESPLLHGCDLEKALACVSKQYFKHGMVKGALHVAERLSQQGIPCLQVEGKGSLAQCLIQHDEYYDELIEKGRRLSDQWSWALICHVHRVQQLDLELESLKQWLYLDPIAQTPSHKTQRQADIERIQKLQGSFHTHLKQCADSVSKQPPGLGVILMMQCRSKVAQALRCMSLYDWLVAFMQPLWNFYQFSSRVYAPKPHAS